MGEFGREFFEWWAGLTPLNRYGIAMVLLMVGAILCCFTDGGYLAWGAFLTTGMVLLMFAGCSEDE